MEYKELQLLWKKYDSKLDNLKDLDKDLILKNLIKQKQNRIKNLIRRNIYHLICYIITYSIIIYSYSNKTGNIDWQFLSGTAILLLSMLDFYLLTRKRNKVLKEINLKMDTVIESIKKLSVYPKTRFKNLKHLIILFPVYLIGCTLLMWNKIVIDSPDPKDKLLFFLVIYSISIIILIPFYNQEKRKIKNLIEEIKTIDDFEE